MIPTAATAKTQSQEGEILFSETLCVTSLSVGEGATKSVPVGDRLVVEVAVGEGVSVGCGVSVGGKGVGVEVAGGVTCNKSLSPG